VTVYPRHARRRVPTGVDVLCDARPPLVFDPGEIAREIDVVLEEIRRSDDSPGSVLSNAVFDAAYAEHLSHPILGPHSVRA